MSYTVLGRHSGPAGLSGLLDDVKVGPDGKLSIPGLGLSNVDLTQAPQLDAAKARVAEIAKALPIDLSSVAGGSTEAGGAWAAQATAAVQAIASGDVNAMIRTGVQAGLVAGGAALCAATGVGATVAPLCGTVAGMLTPVVMKVGEAVAEGVGQLFGMKSSAEKERDRIQARTAAEYGRFLEAKDAALVNLANVESAIWEQTKYAAAQAFATLYGITPRTTAGQVLSQMIRDAGGSIGPNTPVDPKTGFTASVVAAQRAGKDLYDQLASNKEYKDAFLATLIFTLGPLGPQRYQYPGPVPVDGGAPNQVDFVRWWANMPPDVWKAKKAEPIPRGGLHPTKKDASGNPMPCRLRNFAQDDPANGWAGAAVGKSYVYAFPDGFNPTGWGWQPSLLDDADAVSSEIVGWNIKMWNTPKAGPFGPEGRQGDWQNRFNKPDYLAARIREMWDKRVECQISAHLDAFRGACQYQLGEAVKVFMADAMQRRLVALRDQQAAAKRNQAAAKRKQAAAKTATSEADAIKQAYLARQSFQSKPGAEGVSGSSMVPLLVAGGVALAGGAFYMLKMKKKPTAKA